LTNKHSKKHAGFVNDKAVSVQPNEKGGVTLMTKKSGSSHKPASHYNSHGYGKTKSNRRWGTWSPQSMEHTDESSTYKTIADSVGKKSYRGDLNKDAISRASALKNSSRPKKETPERKPRGEKAKKQAE
jgi:large subunit ribosomal protein L28e